MMTETIVFVNYDRKGRIWSIGGKGRAKDFQRKK